MVPEEAVIYSNCSPEAELALPAVSPRVPKPGGYHGASPALTWGAGQSASQIFLVNTPDEYFSCKGIACINYCKEMSLGENDFEIQFNFIVMRRKQEGSMCV